MSTELWKDDVVQFPRLLAEIVATDALTPKVYEQLRELMNLENNEINELLDRAQARWEALKEDLRADAIMRDFRKSVVTPDGNPNEEDWTLAPRHNLWLTVDDFSVHVVRTDEGVVVDVYAKGCEMEDMLATTYALTADARQVMQDVNDP